MLLLVPAHTDTVHCHVMDCQPELLVTLSALGRWSIENNKAFQTGSSRTGISCCCKQSLPNS